MAVNTLRKYEKAALADGWLGKEHPTARCGGKSWRLLTYRCSVPDATELTEKDEMLSDALVSQFGDIDDEAVSLHADTPTSRLNGHAVSHIGDTPKGPSKALRSQSKALRSQEGVSNHHEQLCQNTPSAVSKQTASCVKGVSVKSRKSLNSNETQKEVLELSISEVSELSIQDREGAALPRRTATVGILKSKVKSESSRQQKVDLAAKALDSGLDAEFIRKQYGLTIAEVRAESKTA
jgi:hypothetical protein